MRQTYAQLCIGRPVKPWPWFVAVPNRYLQYYVKKINENHSQWLKLVSAYQLNGRFGPPFINSEGAQGLACKTPIKK